LPPLFGIFRAEGLFRANSVGLQALVSHTISQEGMVNLLGPLLAENQIGAFDSGTVAMADNLNCERLVEIFRLRL
jgi:hypothetical protein